MIVMTQFNQPRPLSELLGDLEQYQGIKQEIAHSLLSMRQEKGMSQRTLARRAGTTQSYVANIESGYRTPSTRTLRKLLDVLEGGEGESHGEGKEGSK